MFQLTTKSVLRALAFFGLAGSSSLIASPMLTLSDNAAVYFVGSASVTSDSNVAYSNENESDDIIFDIQPGFELVAGSPETGADFSLVAAYGIRRYMDFDEFDAELPSVAANATFKSPKSTTKATASYIETQAENRRGIRGVVLKSAITNVGISTDYAATAKSSVAGGVSYDNTSRDTFGSDYSSLSIPVNVYYAATEKLDAGVGYRYRNTSLDGGVFGDRISHFVNVGVRGELSPKLVSDLKVGFQSTDIDGGDNFDGLALDAKLTYMASDKGSADIVLSKDVMVGFAGDVIDNFSTAVSANYLFTPGLSGSAMLVIGTDTYEGTAREDDYMVFQVGAVYSPTYFMSVEAGYVFIENDSNIEGLDFTKNSLIMSVSMRY